MFVPGRPVFFYRPVWRWRMVVDAGVAFGKGSLLFLHPLPFLSEWHTCVAVQATPTGAGIIPLASLRTYHRLPDDMTVYATADAPAAVVAHLEATGYPCASGELASPSAETFATWLDPHPVRERLALLHEGLWLLKLLCTGQFLVLFAGAPLLLQFFGGFQILVPFLAGVYSLGAAIAGLYFWVFLRLHPHEKWLGAGKSVWVFLYPFAAMRAVSLLCKGCCPACHESALALALFSERQRTTYVERAACLLHCQTFSGSLPAEAAQALASGNHLLLEALWRHAEGHTLPADIWENAGVATASQRDDWKAQGAVCYCPVCCLPLTESRPLCPKCVDVRTLRVSEGELPQT